MKKILSLAIAAVLALSATVTAFSLGDPPPAPSPAENSFNIWVEDVNYDPAGSDTVDVYIRISDNTDGFQYIKFYVFYPECLTLTDVSEDGCENFTEYNSSYLDGSYLGPKKKEATESNISSDTLFIDACNANGVDYTDYIDEHMRYITVYADIEYKVNEYDEASGKYEKHPADCMANGRIAKLTFSYDASLNPSEEDIPVKLVKSHPKYYYHCNYAGNPYSNTACSVSLFDGLIKLPYIQGDVDEDGSVTSQDVAELKNILAGSGRYKRAYDVDGDRSITALDLMMLKEILAS